MSAGDVTALAFAVAAVTVAISAVGVMWRRGRRRLRAVRSRHPSARPPLSITVVEVADGRRFRIDIPRSAPTTAIDIVSFQQTAAPGAWQSEPFVEPIVIQPGGFVILSGTVPADTNEFDVVVAWTAQHPIGGVQGSLLFRLPRERGERGQERTNGPALQTLPALVLASALALSGVFVAAEFISAASDESPASDAGEAIVTSTSVATTTLPVPAIPATPPTPPTTNDPPSTIAPSTTSTEPVDSLAVPTSSVATSTAPFDGPQVFATAGLGECRFGTDCLIVGFAIEGFDPRPQEYICEFDDGSRFTFRFDSTGVENACSSGSATAQITVEVAGVRSDTMSRSDA